MELILSNDVLNGLLERFGPKVRQVGTWHSDGVFAYSSIPVSIVRKAQHILPRSCFA
jgi:hypothetical protein